jgi:hypothetical protein
VANRVLAGPQRSYNRSGKLFGQETLLGWLLTDPAAVDLLSQIRRAAFLPEIDETPPLGYLQEPWT